MKNNKVEEKQALGYTINSKRFEGLLHTETQINEILTNEIGIEFAAKLGLVATEASILYNDNLEKLFKTDKPLKVLDLVAGEGSKVNSILNLLREKDFLMVNEANKKQLAGLKSKATAWGFNNILVSQNDEESFSELEDFFDLVFISSKILITKVGFEAPTAKQENDNLLDMKRLFKAGAYLVGYEGHLVVSYSDFEKESFEKISKWLIETLEFEEEVSTREGNYITSIFKCTKEPNKYNAPKITLNRLPLNQVQQLESWIKEDAFKKYQYFLKNDGVVLVISQDLISTYGNVLKASAAKIIGLEIGLFKSGSFVPSLQLAYSNLLKESVSILDLTINELIDILSKNALSYEHEGWHLLKYKGISLGWVNKNDIGQVIKMPF